MKPSLVEMVKNSPELETHFIEGKAVRSIKPFEGVFTEVEFMELLNFIKKEGCYGILRTKTANGKIHVIWNRSISLREQ